MKKIQSGLGVQRTLNVDRFSLMMFSIMILVVIVVSSSQYQQFNLASTAVNQNTGIYNAVHNSIAELKITQHKIEQNIQTVLNNVTHQHDIILDFMQDDALNGTA